MQCGLTANKGEHGADFQFQLRNLSDVFVRRGGGGGSRIHYPFRSVISLFREINF
jgi:hypothetical protein